MPVDPAMMREFVTMFMREVTMAGGLPSNVNNLNGARPPGAPGGPPAQVVVRVDPHTGQEVTQTTTMAQLLAELNDNLNDLIAELQADNAPKRRRRR